MIFADSRCAAATAATVRGEVDLMLRASAPVFHPCYLPSISRTRDQEAFAASSGCPFAHSSSFSRIRVTSAGGFSIFNSCINLSAAA